MQKGQTLFPCETRCRRAALRFRGTRQHGAPLAQGLGPSLSHLHLNFFLQDDPGNHNCRQGLSQSPQESGVGGNRGWHLGDTGTRIHALRAVLGISPLDTKRPKGQTDIFNQTQTASGRVSSALSHQPSPRPNPPPAIRREDSVTQATTRTKPKVITPRERRQAKTVSPQRVISPIQNSRKRQGIHLVSESHQWLSGGGM